ncbi:hypothetical protein L210DRAFT_2540165 [Boletus edulis BED1]|uniref:Protein kinase domain-containing protein n=1 Tax=Boletus edulis BED1 TaxID=1328754 RepID=A0AAD4BN98_BOLED|nr:hypothetical protein L210DRAFT_2540165 [Boletus edulis BED1]
MRSGTLRWAAPEHLSLNEEETKDIIKSDIYSFGNLALLVVCTHRTAFPQIMYNSDPLLFLSGTIWEIPMVRGPS